MMKRFFSLLVPLILLATALPARAQVISLESVSATRVGDTLSAQFGVALQGADEIAETLRNGVGIKLACRASISLNRRFFFNSTLGESAIEGAVQYDALTKEFALMLPGQEQAMRNEDLGALLAEGWKSFSIPLCPWGSLERGKSYQLEVEVALMPMDVPDWFTRTFLFWSWQGGPTVTSTLEFRY